MKVTSVWVKVAMIRDDPVGMAKAIERELPRRGSRDVLVVVLSDDRRAAREVQERLDR